MNERERLLQLIAEKKRELERLEEEARTGGEDRRRREMIDRIRKNVNSLREQLFLEGGAN